MSLNGSMNIRKEITERLYCYLIYKQVTWFRRVVFTKHIYAIKNISPNYSLETFLMKIRKE
jgi:hypothetical protein